MLSIFDRRAIVAGNVIQDDRNSDGFGDLLEMPVKSFLRRLVVVRAYHHDDFP
jgi:hypothetical protein